MIRQCFFLEVLSECRHKVPQSTYVNIKEKQVVDDYPRFIKKHSNNFLSSFNNLLLNFNL